MRKCNFICKLEQFHQLLNMLKSKGYRLLGPTVRNEVIVYDELQSANDLPVGWRDEQDPGYYRLKLSGDQAYFKYQASPHSWKQFLFPSSEMLWSARKEGGKIVGFEEPARSDEKLAFIGVLACDLQALSVLTKVFDKRFALYEQYHHRKENAFILAINCTTSANTCFCTSMGSGPEVNAGYDWAVTEIIDETRHYFLVTCGSVLGVSLRKELSLQLATEPECQEGRALVKRNAEGMKRHVDNEHVRDMLTNNLYSKQWDKAAKQCVNCANCTMACPTCFCSTIGDQVSLNGSRVDRMQTWESCFNLSHSYVHGGSVRSSAKSRYRQWLTHKFGTWWDQFGVSGCVGCGRCITWCPVGIDVTEEIKKLQKDAQR